MAILLTKYKRCNGGNEMELKINRKINQVKPSMIRQMKALADTYEDVIDFTLGEPHVFHETYFTIKEGLHQRIMENSIGYSNHYGVKELRKAIVEYCKQHYNQVYDEDKEIIITSGVSESISAVLKTILEDEDEVIIFSPAFSLYKSNVEMYGGKVVIYDMIANDMTIKQAELSQLITSKTKAIIINSPCNPTGKVFSKEETQMIYDCIKDYPIFIITDEIYREITFDGIECYSLSDYKDLRNRLFILNGVSKSFAMTGWRIGYVLGPEEYIGIVANVHQNFVASSSTISQYAVLEALKYPELTQYIHNLYQFNRDYVYEQLKPYFKNVILPEGAFYLYLDTSNFSLTSKEFAMKLLNDTHVATVPSIAFESYDSGYIRLSYCCDFKVLKEGIERIKKFIKSL